MNIINSIVSSNFFGRKKQIDQFIDIAIKQFQPLRIVGIHGSGKTSFLNFLVSDSKNIDKVQQYQKSKIVYIHVSTLETPKDFYYKVTNQIKKDLNSSSSIQTNEKLDFREFEKSLQKYSKEFQLVILLDGFDNIILSDSFDIHFFRGLRSLMSNKLIWITSLPAVNFDMEFEEKTAYFFNPFHPTPLYLGELEKENAEQFVAQLAENQNLELSVDKIETILKLSGKLPYFIEQITKSWIEIRENITNEQLEKFSKELLKKLLNPDNQIFKQLKLITYSLSKGEVKAILTLLNINEDIGFHEATGYQKILLNYGILREDNGKIKISCELFKSFFSELDTLEMKTFESNLKAKISLNQLDTKGLNFFGEFKWNFQPGVNILLGKNGYGKSHLMRLILTHLQIEETISDDVFFKNCEKGAYVKVLVDRENKSEIIHKINKVFISDIGKIPVLAIPDLRYLDKSKSSISLFADIKKLSENGAFHFIHEKPYSNLVENFFYTFCKDFYFVDSTKDELINKDLDNYNLGNLLKGIVIELTNEDFKFYRILSKPGINQYVIEVITSGNDERNPLPIQKASQGTLSVLIIFGLIHNYLKTIYPDSKENINKERGIVFIDEIDAHLHPAWQQKIVGLLRKTFPNVQFVLSSHSPLVVAGCGEREVAVLRNQERGFTIHQFENDFIGYSAAEIYERIFEIDPFDEDYKNYLTRISEIPGINMEIKKIENTINELGENDNSDRDKELSELNDKLAKLYDDLHYINKAKRKYDKNQEYDRLFRENRKLKYELKEIQNNNQ